MAHLFPGLARGFGLLATQVALDPAELALRLAERAQLTISDHVLPTVELEPHDLLVFEPERPPNRHRIIARAVARHRSIVGIEDRPAKVRLAIRREVAPRSGLAPGIVGARDPGREQ